MTTEEAIAGMVSGFTGAILSLLYAADDNGVDLKPAFLSNLRNFRDYSADVGAQNSDEYRMKITIIGNLIEIVESMAPGHPPPWRPIIIAGGRSSD